MDAALTRIAVVVLALFWVFLLITVVGLEEDSWFLFGVGAVGMAHNVIVAGWTRDSESHGLPLERDSIALIEHLHVFDALLEAEKRREGLGEVLKGLFFPAGLRPSQEQRWQEYERQRRESRRRDGERRDGERRDGERGESESHRELVDNPWVTR